MCAYGGRVCMFRAGFVRLVLLLDVVGRLCMHVRDNSFYFLVQCVQV